MYIYVYIYNNNKFLSGLFNISSFSVRHSLQGFVALLVSSSTPLMAWYPVCTMVR